MEERFGPQGVETPGEVLEPRSWRAVGIRGSAVAAAGRAPRGAPYALHRRCAAGCHMPGKFDMVGSLGGLAGAPRMTEVNGSA
jgi:hypothetical protein